MNIFKGLSGKFLIPYALTMLFGIWTYFSIRNILRLEELQKTFLQLKIDVLELRKDEKDFLAQASKNSEFINTGENEYLSHHRTISSALTEALKHLQKEKVADSLQLAEMLHLLLEYNTTFEDLGKKIRVRGFKDDGMVGDLRQAIHEVENAKLSYDHAYMLMLRRHEKDFFLRNDLSYAEKFTAAVDPFKQHIRQSAQNPSQREKLLQLIDRYHQLFLQVVEIDGEIGLDENSGLLGELRSSIHQLTPYLDNFIDTWNTHIRQEINQNIVVLIVLFVLIIAFGIFILNYHIRKITRNINIINKTAVSLSTGKFAEEYKVNSKDELGQAHQALNKLSLGLKAKTQFAEEIRIGQLKTSFDTLGENDKLGTSLIDMRDNLLTVTKEINKAIRKASEEGNLEIRVSTELRQGAWLKLSTAINSLLISVSEPLHQINVIANALANGDLTKTYNQSAQGAIQEMAINLNQGLERIEETLIAILESTMEIASSSEEMLVLSGEMDNSTTEIASAISQMSLGSHQQLKKVDEASKLIESILRLANTTVDISRSINTSAHAGIQNSKDGQRLIQDLKTGMDTVAVNSQSTKNSMRSLVDYSSKIDEVLRVMTGISSQTNLLALNAAIEAAQAGESGRGFAVVAEEIRKLAESSKKSAKEIEQLIREIQQETSSTERIIQEMDQNVKNGLKMTTQASDAFNQNTLLAEQILDLSNRIVSSASQQETDLKEVVTITESIVIISEQSASGAEQVASSAAELSGGMKNFHTKSEILAKIAQTLQLKVGSFTLHSRQSAREISSVNER